LDCKIGRLLVAQSGRECSRQRPKKKDGMAKKITPKKAVPAKLLVVGKSYFVQTVTHYYTGKLVRDEKENLVLTNASWIADTGRFSDFLKTGNANEVEPFPPELETGVAKSAIINVCSWPHTLPNVQK
jgi:hypothetical protein